MNRFTSALSLAAGTAVLGLSAQVFAAALTETEPNQTRATANLLGPLVTGDTIGGSSPSSVTDPDYLNMTTGVQALGIYRNTIAWNAGSVFSRIRGYTVTAGAPNPASDASLQLNPGTAPFENTWYTFGRATTAPMLVNNNSTTPAYSGTYSQSVVVPVVGPDVPVGNVTISTQGLTTVDTDLWVYDSNFNAIPGFGNDDSSTANGQSSLTRPFAAGTYYVAIGAFNVANNLPSPPDDLFTTGSVLSFQDMIISTSSTANADLDMSIGGINVSVLGGPDDFNVSFVKFTVGGGVVPEPTSLAVLGLAGAGLVARRRRA